MGQSQSLLYLTMRSEMFKPKSSLMAYEHYSCSQLITKQSVKLIMTFVIEKSL